MGAEVASDFWTDRLIRSGIQGKQLVLKPERHRLPAVDRLEVDPTVGQAAPSERVDAPQAQICATYAKFSVDRETNRVRIEIVDASSGDVVRQIPPWEPKVASEALALALDGIKRRPEKALQAHAYTTPEVVRRLTRE